MRVNGKKIKENYRLLLDDKIQIKFLNVSISSEKKDNKNISNIKYDKKYYQNIIIFENEDFFIVNKPNNIPMHKGTGHKFGLSEIYKDLYKNNNINFANRLDYETSGLVIGCKTMKFLRYISEKIRENEVTKKYITVVHGQIENNKFKIENYLETMENGVKVYETQKGNSKLSISNFTKIDNIKLEITERIKSTILEVDLVTGRKHQIRTQLANAGMPIIGDKKYGKKDGSKIFYLCCYFIAFDEYVFELENNKILNF